jgi:hypothetical protein
MNAVGTFSSRVVLLTQSPQGIDRIGADDQKAPDRFESGSGRRS